MYEHKKNLKDLHTNMQKETDIYIRFVNNIKFYMYKIQICIK